MDIKQQIDIKAPPETIFELVSDIDSLRMWADDITDSAFLTEYDPACPVGARFRQTASQFGHEITYEGEITECTSPTLFTVLIGSEKFKMIISYRLRKLKAATRLTYTAKLIEATLKYRVLFTAISSLAREKLIEQLDKLRALAEEGA